MDRLSYRAFWLILVATAVGGIGLPIAVEQNYLGVESAGLWLRGISVIATVLLVGGTYLTIQQNQRDIEEVRKGREKPLVRDEIEHVVVPAIDALQNDIDDSEKGLLDWFNAGNRLMGGSAMGPRSGIDFIHSDHSARRRLKETSPELYSDLEDREDLILELCEVADEIAEEIKPFVEQTLRDEAPDSSDPEEFEHWVRTVLDTSIRQIDHFGESHELYEFWEEHGDHLIAQMKEVAGSKVTQLEQGEEEMIDLSKDLVERLVEEQMRLRREYGISSREIEANHRWRNDPASKTFNRRDIK
ncbi:hypothetical protein ACOZ4B_10745 [Haloferax prahovense]|uniref:hypothetical protein n=1 Tax=Haloferax prahovense TaxID=381852 RepID=UPI003C78189B